MGLNEPLWQGLGAIATIVFGVLGIAVTVWAAVRTSAVRNDSGARPGSAVSGARPRRTGYEGVILRVSCALMTLVVTCICYVAVWATLAAGMGYHDISFVAAPQMIALGTLPAVGALLLRPAAVGTFLGGLPLGLFALYLVSSDTGKSMAEIATPFEYFVVFSIFGGMIGVLTATPAVALARKVGLPLPRT